jgi:hypothetical protein
MLLCLRAPLLDEFNICRPVWHILCKQAPDLIASRHLLQHDGGLQTKAPSTFNVAKSNAFEAMTEHCTRYKR